VATILLVEDNELNRDMLSRRLVKNGFQISLAVDGLESVKLAKSEQPDLILMDMSLPVMDGWEATLQIKADPMTCNIPVIALTAHAMGEDRAKALSAGCDEYDTKPIELSRLLSKIHKFLE
jgi:CheY-like chemotaxis protein